MRRPVETNVFLFLKLGMHVFETFTQALRRKKGTQKIILQKRQQEKL